MDVFCTVKSRSCLLAPAHPGGPGKRAVKWLWCGSGCIFVLKLISAFEYVLCHLFFIRPFTGTVNYDTDMKDQIIQLLLYVVEHYMLLYISLIVEAG